MAELVLTEKAERARASGLAAEARKGTHAIFGMRVVSLILTFISITLLARLIPPADFGIWAMAGFALGVMTIVRELGLAPSIVQAPSLSLRQQDAYFWTSVAVSTGCAALLALVAPLVARLYNTPLLAPVIWACCISLAVNGLGAVHAALLRRQLQYTKLVLIEGGGMVFGLIVGLTTAYVWRDVWALAVGHIAAAVWMSASALLLCPWVPGMPQRSARINLGFSLQLTLYNLLTYAANNVGLAAGYRFGAAELGFFNRGQQLFHMSHYSFLTPITDMGFALLCRLKSDATYKHAYLSLVRRIALLFIPYAAVLPIVSRDLVLALLGAAWEPATPIIAWFAPAVLGQAFATLLAQLLTSQGRGAELRRWATGSLLVRAAGAIIGSAFGIVGLAAGFALATLLLVFPMAWLTGRSGPVTLRDQLAALWPGLLLAGAASVAALVAALGADALNLGAGLPRLAFIGGNAALVWTALCFALRTARDSVLGKGMARE